VFLVGDAKALLFINDYQPQVFEGNILLQQPVGADADVYSTISKTIKDSLLLFW